MEEFYMGEDNFYEGALYIPALFKNDQKFKLKKNRFFQLKVRSNIKT